MEYYRVEAKQYGKFKTLVVCNSYDDAIWWAGVAQGIEARIVIVKS